MKNEDYEEHLEVGVDGKCEPDEHTVEEDTEFKDEDTRDLCYR